MNELLFIPGLIVGILLGGYISDLCYREKYKRLERRSDFRMKELKRMIDAEEKRMKGYDEMKHQWKGLFMINQN